MDISRKHDVKDIEKGLKDPDPLVREVAGNARNNINKENGWTRSARERLIKETLAGNKDNAKQVRDDMVRRRGGRLMKGNRGEVITKKFNWAPGQWEEVYGHKQRSI